MTVDLHTHSTASDGTDTPEELVNAAAAAGLRAIAITDHDTTDGWAEAARAAKAAGIALVRGTEISCRYHSVSVHLLSYLHDPTEPTLEKTLLATVSHRDTRAQKLVQRLADDFPITWEAVTKNLTPGTVVGRPHIADALVTAGSYANRNEAFADALNDTSQYYVPYQAPETLDAVALVKAAGGVAVLAHPFAKARRQSSILDALPALVEAGLSGIECGHPEHSPEDEAQARALAKKHGLLETNGSDYHGRGKTQKIGARTAPWSLLDSLAELGKLPVLLP